ncbi:hypothetical protein FUAX_18920 [Fulvitalea axinellae]|uniref:SusD/RagB family nutrient-binding outer membrane lipoprotein n=1 Tax=Fulvitalea axinellae TaxID=1182444 RepID=A0AAU9DEU3_9BACT|nr:hypothetical protein FUAX_18920 [Fulvitalea axinellae]
MNIYKKLLVFGLVTLSFFGCDDKLDEYYYDSSKVTKATVDNFLTGLLKEGNNMTFPSYNYIVSFTNPSVSVYTQSRGYSFSTGIYSPGGSQNMWWGNYFNVVRQYRELESLYSKLTDKEKEDKKIFMIAAKIYMHYQTERTVSMFGDIPWSEAGMLKSNNGDLEASKPKYDDDKEIYKQILKELKEAAVELNDIEVPAFVANSFKDKDFINNGDIDIWKRFCNSLRVKLLTRVSGADGFDVKGELAEIFSNPATYPVIESNEHNVFVKADGPNMFTRGLRSGYQTWNLDLASYVFTKHMVDNKDPRLEVMLDPTKDGKYVGLDPDLPSDKQQELISDGKIARLDSATFMHNELCHGLILTASEVLLCKAEAATKGFISADANEAFTEAIEQSTKLFHEINARSTHRTPLTLDEAAMDKYTKDMSLADATNKLEAIMWQKYLHLAVLRTEEAWAEIRRTGYPEFSFKTDNNNTIKTPPTRLSYPESEKSWNGAHYALVKKDDTPFTKLFWAK